MKGKIMLEFKNRKEQLEKGIARRLRAKLKQEGIGYFTDAQNRAIRKALRDAAMVGACEERGRILKFESMNSCLRELIVAPSVLSVLGYE